ncbi:MAG: MFS transporter [Bacteriovoracaceae bacterium]
MTKFQKNDVLLSIKDSIFYSLMQGSGENFLCAFLLAMGVGDVWAGLVSVIPILLGAFLQLYSSYGLKLFSSYKKWVVFCVVVQALSFLPLIFIARMGSAPLWVVFFFVSVYWGSGMAASTAWNVWIANLIPGTMKKGFFSNRGLFSQVFTLLGLAIAGSALHMGEKAGLRMEVFSVLFFAAFCLRLISAFYLTQHSEMFVAHQFSPTSSFKEFFQELKTGKASDLFKFILFFYVCVHISAPYFSPFMLSKLNLSYQAYMVLIACAYVTKSLAYHLLGTWMRRIPNHKLLLLGSIGVTGLPWLWTLSSDFFTLCLVQMVSGFMWAIYELAAFLLTMELVPDLKRSKVLSYYNVINYVGILIGALIGGMFLSLKGKSFEAFIDLFYLSSFVRFIALALLPSFYLNYRKQIKLQALN